MLSAMLTLSILSCMNQHYWQATRANSYEYDITFEIHASPEQRPLSTSENFLEGTRFQTGILGRDGSLLVCTLSQFRCPLDEASWECAKPIPHSSVIMQEIRGEHHCRKVVRSRRCGSLSWHIVDWPTGTALKQ